MAGSRSSNPRRRSAPQQERSRLMVERIVTAGRAVLIERGFDGATTNRIAEAAGISPGSLYQYFPDKEAIISEVVDRYADQIAARVTAHMTTQIGTPDEAIAIRQTIAVLLDAMDEQPELLRATFEHTPRLGVGDKIAAFEERVGDIAIAHMRLRAQPASHSATACPLRLCASIRKAKVLIPRSTSQASSALTVPPRFLWILRCAADNRSRRTRQPPIMSECPLRYLLAE